MKLTHQLRRFDVYRILVAEGSLLNTENEGKVFYMCVELIEVETNESSLVEIVKLKGLEVAQQEIPRQLVLFESGKIIKRLFLGSDQIAPGAVFVPDQRSGDGKMTVSFAPA